MFRTKEAISAQEIEESLLAEKSEARKIHLMRFFKTGKGDYGENDEFLGLTVPQTRSIVKLARRKVSLEEIEKLIYSKWHESRLAGFLLLAEEMKAALPGKKDKDDSKLKKRRELAEFYLHHARQANNWDLVDLSCGQILGYYLMYDGERNFSILLKLADSDNLWEQRIGMVTNWVLIRNNIFEPAIKVAEKLLDHPHDLIHKAVGWMLREIGKRDKEVLDSFLEDHFRIMSRTTLRYAIEKYQEEERQFWLKR